MDKLTLKAFTLLELLIAAAILTVLIALGATTLQTRQAADLSVGVSTLTGILDEARQMALAQNRYIQVRLLRESPGAPFSAVLLMAADSPYYRSDAAGYALLLEKGQMRQASPVRQFGQGLVIAAGTLSPLLERLEADPEFLRTGSMRAGGRDWRFVAFYYRPNGATDFEAIAGTPLDPTEGYWTLVRGAELEAAGSSLPANVALFTFFPTTGRPVVFRP